VIEGAADPHVRFRLAPSQRLKYLQTGFICAVACAIWLLVAPRLGGLFAAAAVGLAVVWLAWRVGVASIQAPCGLIAQSAGSLSLIDGTRPLYATQLDGLVQWPGMLVLSLAHGSGGCETILVMSDSLDPAQFRALAAWSRRHAGRDAVLEM